MNPIPWSQYKQTMQTQGIQTGVPKPKAVPWSQYKQQNPTASLPRTTFGSLATDKQTQPLLQTNGGLWNVPVVGQVARFGAGMAGNMAGAGLSIGALGARGVSGLAGAMGNKQGQQFYGQVADTAGRISKALEPQGTGIFGTLGKVAGEAAMFGDVGADVVKVGIGAASKIPFVASRLAERTTNRIAGYLTPKLAPTAYKEASFVGKIESPSWFSGGKEAVTPEHVAMAHAINDIASALGKKSTDLVKVGIGKVQSNINSLNSAIKDYSKKVVAPFVKSTGANYNFMDLRGVFANVKPTTFLNGEALSTYNKIRESLLSKIANKVGPEVKNIGNLAEFRAKAPSGTVPKKLTQGDVDFWDARKIIDEVVKDETKGKAFGDKALQGADAAYKDFRSAFQQYLSDAYRYPGQMENVNRANEYLQTQPVAAMDKTGWYLSQFEQQFGLVRNPTSDAMASQWEKYMDNMHKIYDARRNLVTKIGTEKGKSLVELYANEPWVKTAKIVSGGTALTGGAVVGGGALLHAMSGK